MSRPGPVWDSANREDSERPPIPEIGMQCMSTRLHAEHIWQMSATGWCFCYGLETTPVFDALERKYNSELSMYQFMGGALRIISDSS